MQVRVAHIRRTVPDECVAIWSKALVLSGLCLEQKLVCGFPLLVAEVEWRRTMRYWNDHAASGKDVGWVAWVACRGVDAEVVLDVDIRSTQLGEVAEDAIMFCHIGILQEAHVCRRTLPPADLNVVNAETITLVPYDPEWRLQFESERQRLQNALSRWLQGGIHHVGSTAIPGIAAKPVIDIIAGVRNLKDARDAFDALRELGYYFEPHRPEEAHHFAKPLPPAPRTHNLHLTEPGSALWRERLAFRDALRSDLTLLLEYEALKRRIYADHNAGRATLTSDSKRPFVARVLASAGVELRPR